MGEPLIEFKNVTKSFGERTILDRVNLEVRDGEVTTIIGKSGTGKSVLLKHMIGLLAPTQGEILFRGRPVESMSRKELDELRSQFSYCFQNNALFDSLTVFENVALPLQQTTRMSRQEIESKVRERIDQLELSEVPHKYPSELSGGMQKRVALARALITDPKIVLFDEPTTGQDPIRKNAIFSMIVHNQKKFGFTTIMISHDIPDVFFISDRILVLYDGQIIFQGPYDEIDKLEHPMVDEFVKSLEHFQDELTGLYSKKTFTKVYENAVSHKQPGENLTVAVFTVADFDGVSENLGHTTAQEIVQSLAVYVSKHFGDVGISNRSGRDRIVTILAFTGRDAAQRLMENLAGDLGQRGLIDIQAEARAAKSYTLSILGGLAEGKAGEDIDVIAARAQAQQKEIARFQCGLPG
ncbi:MAG: ABC-type transport system involved in resistance to organic solvent, ATPase component [Deltaproteobacteria bacterium]|nr:ABC-type transport system involved in resistance to organic solvent, ATPase component [Deltaproteobacteria bacterium]